MKLKVIASLYICALLFMLNIGLPSATQASSDDTPIDRRSTYLYFLPLASGGNTPHDPQRFVSGGFPFSDFDRELWCELGTPCHPVSTLDEFVYQAPEGYVISFVRLFSYWWIPPFGAHFLYPSTGCIDKVCLQDVVGSMADKNAKIVRIYIDDNRLGYGGPIQLADICIEKEGFPYTTVCDSNYFTRGNVFYPEP